MSTQPRDGHTADPTPASHTEVQRLTLYLPTMREPDARRLAELVAQALGGPLTGARAPAGRVERATITLPAVAGEPAQALATRIAQAALRAVVAELG